MCKLKSALVLKDKVFCPDYDSHDKMLNELKIKDTVENAERLFVRVELSPNDEDVFSDINTWDMHVDQDIVPEWFVAEAEKPRVISAVKIWAEKHIIENKKDVVLNDGENCYLKNCSAKLWGNSTATLYDNSTAKLYDNSTAELCGNSTATLYDNSTAKLWGNSTATLYDNSTAKLWGNSTATLYDNSTATIPTISSVAAEKVVLKDSSTLKNVRTKTIYQAGSEWRFVQK